MSYFSDDDFVVEPITKNKRKLKNNNKKSKKSKRDEDESSSSSDTPRGLEDMSIDEICVGNNMIIENEKEILNCSKEDFTYSQNSMRYFKPTNGKGTFLVCCKTNSKYQVDVESLRLSSIKNVFHKTGHCLSLDSTNNYSFPFVIDFDCKDGKNCRDIKSAVDKITTARRLLPIVKEALSFLNGSFEILVQHRIKSCGFHFYCNFKVSIFLYDYLLTILMNHNKIVDLLDDANLHIDHLSHGIPLFYYSKLERDPYVKLLGDEDRFEMVFINEKYYDFELGYSSVENTNNIVLFSLKETPITTNEWSIFDSSKIEEFYTRSVTPAIIETSAELSVLNHIRFKNNITVASNNKRFSIFIENQKNKLSNMADLTNIINKIPLSDTVEDKYKNIYECFDLMGSLVSAELGLKECDNVKIFMLPFFNNLECDFTYKYFIATSILFFRRLGKHKFMTEFEFTTFYFECLNSITTLNDLTMHILSKITQLKHITEHWAIFRPNAERLIKYIFSTYETSKYNLDLFKHQNEIIKEYRFKLEACKTNYDDLVECLLTILKNVFIVASREENSGTYYLYTRGTYKEIDGRKFMEDKCFTGEIVFTLVQIGLKHREALLQQQKALCRFFEEETIKASSTFGCYKHFIQVNDNVFNTITGTYMTPTPFLFFEYNKYKSIGISVSYNNILGSPTENLQLINDYSKWDRLFDCFLFEQEMLFVKSVIAPSLICPTIYNSTIYTHKFDDLPIHKFASIIFKLSNSSRKLLLEIIKNHVKIENWENLGEVLMSLIRSTKFITLEIIKRNIESTNGNAIDKELISYLFVIFFRGIFIDEKCNEFRNHFYCNFPLVNLSKDCCYMCTYNESGYYRKALFDTLCNFSQEMVHDFVDIFENLSYTFSFDIKKIQDFLNYLSLQFQPQNINRSFILLSGVKNSGKSRFSKFLREINQPSVYSINSVVESSSGSSKPREDMVSIYSSYFVQISEVLSIDSPTIKALTGHDDANVRMLYKSAKLHTAICLVIGMCNALPKMKNPDLAVESRVIVIKFENMATNMNEISNSIGRFEDNPLLMFIEKRFKYGLKSTERERWGFHTLMYLSFLRNLVDNHFCILKIKSTDNLREIENFMCKNNICRRIIKKNNFVLKKNSTVKESDFKEIIEVAIKDIDNLKYDTFKQILIDTCDVVEKNGFLINIHNVDKNEKPKRYRIKIIEEKGSTVPINDIVRNLLINGHVNIPDQINKLTSRFEIVGDVLQNATMIKK